MFNLLDLQKFLVRWKILFVRRIFELLKENQIHSFKNANKTSGKIS